MAGRRAVVKACSPRRGAGTPHRSPRPIRSPRHGRSVLMRILPAAVGFVAALALGGCSMGYYAQSVAGHVDLLQRARPVEAWLTDPATPGDLRERLELATRLRAFSVRELQLPDNASYRRFADLGRPAVVWNVVATPELSLELKTWCYPVMGCAGYRGYFDRAGAQAAADELRQAGWEVGVYGVPAYSTLGWSNWLGGDPLLSTFVHWPEAELARLLFHELAHQVVYVPDDTTFNESFATAVERVGLRRWLACAASPQARAEHEAAQRRRRDFQALTLAARAQLQAIYRGADSDADKRAAKARVLARLRADHAALKAGTWAGFAGYDGWFERVNNASLAVQAAYDDLVPGFERLFEAQGGDFAGFYASVRRLAALPKDERRDRLRTEPATNPETGETPKCPT